MAIGKSTSVKLGIAGIVLLTGIVAIAYLRPFDKKARDEKKSTPPLIVAKNEELDEKKLEERIQHFCGVACHQYASPDVFPRKHWKMEVERGFKFAEDAGLIHNAPSLDQVVAYFEKRSPVELPEAKIENSKRLLDVEFERISYPYPGDPGKMAISHVGLVRLPRPGAKLDPKGPLDIIACDMNNGRILLLRPYEEKPEWKIIGKVDNPARAEVVDLDGDGILDILVANLGSFPPTDRRCGGVVLMKGKPDGTYENHTLLKDVGRVADVRYADFRGTGKLDLVVAVFGLITTGEIIFLENQTTDWSKPKFEPQVVDTRHGAIHVPVADLNGDGKPDFVAVIAQEHEEVVAYINEGKGKFKSRLLFQAPHPGWGSSGIELVDMNNDGQLDILYSNGDILDEPYMLKPYHSIQWLENKGNLKFEHHPITPFYGAHHVVSGKVLGSGLKDAVAVSFLPADKFPERQTKQLDAVMLLEQVAPGKFERHPLLKVECDSTSVAVGDIFQSGRQDIVIGNFISPTTTHPAIILRNKGKKK